MEGGGLEGLDEAAAGVLDQLLDAAAEGEDGAREGVRALDDSAVAANLDRLFAEPKKNCSFLFFSSVNVCPRSHPANLYANLVEL